MQFRGDYYGTGDRAKMDEDGYFWFEGRGDDIIISSGYTIGPFEVEDALTKHPQSVNVQSLRARMKSEGILSKHSLCYVILNGKMKMVSLKNYRIMVKSLTAPYKYPRNIEFLDALPKTASGKIMRIELRKQEQR